jgi:hypothetical protein
MATRIPAQPERQLSIGRSVPRAILRAPDKVGRHGVPPVSQSNCCAERCTVDILKHGSAGRLPACMWRRVSLAAQIRSIECQLSSLWRLRTIQYLMELAQPFNTHCHLIGGKPPTSSVARCEVESCATLIGGVYGATDFSLVLQENIPATEGSKTFSLSIYRQLAQACSKPLPIQSQTDPQPATPHSYQSVFSPFPQPDFSQSSIAPDHYLIRTTYVTRQEDPVSRLSQ